MSTGIYIGTDGNARKPLKCFIGIDGIAREVKKGYIGVDGKARLCYNSAPAALFTFTINGNGLVSDGEFQAEAGMTWEAWISSPYNTRGEEIFVDYGYVYFNGWYTLYNQAGSIVSSFEEITEGTYEVLY